MCWKYDNRPVYYYTVFNGDLIAAGSVIGIELTNKVEVYKFKEKWYLMLSLN